MIQNYSIWKVLRVFFNDPNPKEGFTIRWISKQINLAPTSVKLHLEELSKGDKKGYPMVIKSEGISYPNYRANRDSELFRFYKKMDMIFRLEGSGLLEYLLETCNPHAIILFGSASRGEDDIMSDIDIFLESNEKKLELVRYEQLLKRKISLHFSKDINSLPRELRNNVINGIILKGYLKVF